MHGGIHLICMVATRDGVLPVLFTEGAKGSAPVLGQLALVRHLARQGYSPSQQLKVTESLGRFCDWVRSGEDAAALPASVKLPDVLRRLVCGTIAPTPSPAPGAQTNTTTDLSPTARPSLA